MIEPPPSLALAVLDGADLVARGARLLARSRRVAWFRRDLRKITPVRVVEADELGLDETMHGQTAYQLGGLPAPAA